MNMKDMTNPVEKIDSASESHGSSGGEVSFVPFEEASNSRFYVAVPFEYHKEMEYLTDEEFGALIRALLRFGMTGEVPVVDGVLRHYINRVIERQRRFQEDWRSMAEKRSKAGKIGASKRWNKCKTDETNCSGDGVERQNNSKV